MTAGFCRVSHSLLISGYLMTKVKKKKKSKTKQNCETFTVAPAPDKLFEVIIMHMRKWFNYPHCMLACIVSSLKRNLPLIRSNFPSFIFSGAVSYGGYTVHTGLWTKSFSKAWIHTTNTQLYSQCNEAAIRWLTLFLASSTHSFSAISSHHPTLIMKWRSLVMGLFCSFQWLTSSSGLYSELSSDVLWWPILKRAREDYDVGKVICSNYPAGQLICDEEQDSACRKVLVSQSNGSSDP